MANGAIGLYRCPCCGSEKARVTVSKAGLAVVTCNRCHCQMFARSEVSDDHIRQRILPLTTHNLPLPGVGHGDGEGGRARVPVEIVTGKDGGGMAVEAAPGPGLKKRNAFDIYS